MGDGNYITAAEVVAYKVDGEVVDLSGYSTAEIEAKIALVESMVETICNDIFYVKTETNLFDGVGRPTVFFAPRVPYPLISITLCQEIDIDATVLEVLTENDDFVKYEHYLEVAKAWPGDSPRRGAFRGGIFPKGQKNIQVTGTWGRSTTPLEIKEACYLLVLELLVPQSTGMPPSDVTQAVWSDFTVTFKGGEAGQETGYAKVDRMLARYVNYVDLFLDATGG